MYGDFSRLTFSETDNYAAVWSQQGRELVDSDLNELTAIMLDHLRRLTVDVLGPFAAAYPGNAFRITADPSDPSDLWVEPGEYYVHGIRCRLVEYENTGIKTPCRFRSLAGPGGVPPFPEAPFVVELVVWEQTVSSLQQPRLVDPGLGPYAPDSLRTAVRFALRTCATLPNGAAVTAEETCVSASRIYEDHNNEVALHATRPLLCARTRKQTESDDPSEQLPLRQGYRRPENQLYRVEVHTGGRARPAPAPTSWAKGGQEGQATFKWSRDNASAQFKILGLGRNSDDSQITATLDDTGHDEHTDLDEGDWVELRDDTWSPLRPLSPLLKVVDADRGSRLITLDGPDDFVPQSIDPSLHPFLIRWDQRDDVATADNAVPIPTKDDPTLEGDWLEIEDGLQIHFAHPDAVYQAGDYWLIPARSATGALLWPSRGGEPASVQASRPVLYRAPLALIRSTKGETEIVDLRNFGRYGLLPPAATGPYESGSPTSGTPYQTGGSNAGQGTGSAGTAYQQTSAGPAPTTQTSDYEEGATLATERTERTDISRLSATAQGGVVGAVAEPLIQLTVEEYDAPAETHPITAGWTFTLPMGQHRVGRAEGQAIRLTDTTVSRTHAIISVEDGECWVWEVSSESQAGALNRTFLVRDGNETQIVKSVRLQQGDIVKFGAVPIRVDFLKPPHFPG